MKPFLPDAKVVAMVNDLSPEALASLLCMSSNLETRFRYLIQSEYRHGRVEASLIIDTWETDDD